MRPPEQERRQQVRRQFVNSSSGDFVELGAAAGVVGGGSGQPLLTSMVSSLTGSDDTPLQLESVRGLLYRVSFRAMYASLVVLLLASVDCCAIVLNRVAVRRPTANRATTMAFGAGGRSRCENAKRSLRCGAPCWARCESGDAAMPCVTFYGLTASRRTHTPRQMPTFGESRERPHALKRSRSPLLRAHRSHAVAAAITCRGSWPP